MAFHSELLWHFIRNFCGIPFTVPNCALSAITLVVNAQVGYNHLGNLTIGNPYHGCISTLCRTDSIYKYAILGNGNHGVWGFDLAESPSLSIHILQGIIDALS